MLSRFSNRLVWLFGASLFLLINFCNFLYYNQQYWPFSLTPIRILGLSVLFAAVTVVGLWVLKVIWPYFNQHWELWLLGLALFLRVVWVLVAKTPPTQDYFQLHQASLAFAHGVSDFATQNQYVNFSPYMLGFVLYQGSVIKLFGDSLLLLQLLNCLFSVVTIYFVGQITNRLYGKRAQILAMLMMTVYVPNVVVTSVLTNDILAVAFFMLAIWLLVAYPLTWKSGAMIGLVIFAGNFIRPLASIILLAVTLYELFIDLPTRQHKRRVVLGLASLLLAFGIANLGSNYLVQATGISPQSITTTNTDWKLALGLNADSDGKWNPTDYSVVNVGKTPSQRQQLAHQLVVQRASNPRKLVGLFAKKFAVMWADIDTTISWGTKHTNVPKLVVGMLCVIQKAMYLVITVLVSWTLLKNPRGLENLIVILLIGYILVHLGIEIQTRYRYFAMPLMIILASGTPFSAVNKPNQLVSRRIDGLS